MELTTIADYVKHAEQAADLDVTVANAPLLGSKDDRHRWLAAFKLFQYLPRQGEFGGGMADISREVGVSRNYVHLTFYPTKPDSIFTGNSDRQVAIWNTLAAWVERHPLKVPIEKILEQLLARGSAEVRIKKSLFNFLTKRLRDMGIRHKVVEERATSPRTYVIELEDLVEANSVALIGKTLELDKK